MGLVTLNSRRMRWLKCSLLPGPVKVSREQYFTFVTLTTSPLHLYQWRIYIVKFWMCTPPLLVQFSCSLRKIWPNNRLALLFVVRAPPPPQELPDPPLSTMSLDPPLTTTDLFTFSFRRSRCCLLFQVKPSLGANQRFSC